MKTKTYPYAYKRQWLFALCLSLVSLSLSFAQEASALVEIEGKIINSNSRTEIPQATITLLGTNLSTVSNEEGKFSLKIPATDAGKQINIRALGFKEKTVLLPKNLNKSLRIALDYSTINLDPATLIAYTDARSLVDKVLNKRKDNYVGDKKLMTAFYRETIKNRNKNASLAEAVVAIYKQPYASNKRDQIKMIKSRKDTDYTKLDTITLKLQGGPFSTLYVDVMKYPEYIFAPQNMDGYDFTFGNVTEINGENVLVVKFKQKDEVITPLYEGNLFIGASTLALIKAEYSLRLDNTREVSDMFVRRKPVDVNVKPRNISYEVNYREKNGKWIYGYSKADLSFEVKKRRKLFKSIYSLSCEMAVTDWEAAPADGTWDGQGEINKYIIMADQNIGFGDPEFWGEYNVIEPEKSIESAIKKIQRKLEREEERASLGGR